MRIREGEGVVRIREGEGEGEGVERSKGGERRAVREGVILVRSTLVAIRGGGCWPSLIIVILLHRHVLLLSFIAVRRA